MGKRPGTGERREFRELTQIGNGHRPRKNAENKGLRDYHRKGRQTGFFTPRFCDVVGGWCGAINAIRIRPSVICRIPRVWEWHNLSFI